VTIDKLKRDLDVILEKMQPVEMKLDLVTSFLENNNYEQIELEDVDKAHKRKRDANKMAKTEPSAIGGAHMLHAVGMGGERVFGERRKHSDRMLSHMRAYDKEWESSLPQVDVTVPYTPPTVECHPWKVLIIGLEEEDTSESITEGLASMHDLNLIPRKIIPKAIEKWNERTGPPCALNTSVYLSWCLSLLLTNGM